MLRRIGAILDRIDAAMAIVSASLIVLVGLALLYEVLARYIFNRPTMWTVEASRFALLYITFLGVSWVLRKESHVRIDMLLDILKPRWRALLNMATSLVCVLICLIVVWFGAKVSWDSFSVGYRLETEMRTPQVVVLAVIPLGMLLFLFGFVRRTCRYLREFRELSPGSKERV